MILRAVSAIAALALAAPAGAQDAAMVAEPQVPTGKFTTATEVRPVLQATRGTWVAVREWEGQDLIYVTHVLSWRCGLSRLRVAVNGGDLRDWPMPPCRDDSATPNAITPDDGPIYAAYPVGSVESVQVELVYDDLSTERAAFDRAAILIQ